jgi:hypothetical protein
LKLNKGVKITDTYESQFQTSFNNHQTNNKDIECSALFLYDNKVEDFLTVPDTPPLPDNKSLKKSFNFRKPVPPIDTSTQTSQLSKILDSSDDSLEFDDDYMIVEDSSKCDDDNFERLKLEPIKQNSNEESPQVKFKSKDEMTKKDDKENMCLENDEFYPTLKPNSSKSKTTETSDRRENKKSSQPEPIEMKSKGKDDKSKKAEFSSNKENDEFYQIQSNGCKIKKIENSDKNKNEKSAQSEPKEIKSKSKKAEFSNNKENIYSENDEFYPTVLKFKGSNDKTTEKIENKKSEADQSNLIEIKSKNKNRKDDNDLKTKESHSMEQKTKNENIELTNNDELDFSKIVYSKRNAIAKMKVFL